MKFDFSSKAVRTLGLITLLSVMVGTTVQQSAQAEIMKSNPGKDCIPLPQGKFFNEFEGMTFSREQDKAYQKIRAARNRRAEALSKTYRSVADPSQGVDLAFRKGIGARKTAEINAALDVFIRDRVPTAQQVKLINQKYGRYVTASFARVPVPFTPAQIAAGQKMWRDFEAQTTAILTPEQQKTYRSQLVILRGIEACMEPSPFSPRMGSSYTTVDGIKREV